MARSNKSRRVKKSTRRGKKGRRFTRRQRGGMAMNPAGVDDKTMLSSSSQSLAQGVDYNKIHAGQHGGGAPMMGAPVGTTGVLDSSLRSAARIGPLDDSVAAIQGMSDQSGGRRRRNVRRRGGKKSKKSKKGKGRRRNTRRQYGGANFNPADVSAPGSLLSPAMEQKALMGMNPEWKLAADPTSFAPKA